MKLCNPLFLFLALFVLFFLFVRGFSPFYYLRRDHTHRNTHETRQFHLHVRLSRGSFLLSFLLLHPYPQAHDHRPHSICFSCVRNSRFYLSTLKERAICCALPPPPGECSFTTPNRRVHISFQLVCVNLLVGQVRVQFREKRIFHCAKNVNA